MTKWFDTTHTHNNRVGVLWSTNLKVNLILLLLFDLSEDVWHVSQNLNTHIKKKRCEAFTLRQGVEICMVPALFDMETWIPTCWSLKTKATPGRLCDSLDKRHTVLNQCTYVVIDEAPGCCNCELHKLNQIRVWELIFWREFWWPILNPECQELYQADKMVDLGFEEGKYRKNMDKNPAIAKMVNHISILQLNVVDRTMWDESCWQFQLATWRQTMKTLLRSRTHETSTFARYWWPDIWEVSKKNVLYMFLHATGIWSFPHLKWCL